MPRKKIFAVLAGMLGAAITCGPAAHARILFVETFSTSTTPVASGQWDVSQTGTDFILEEDAAGQGPGDGLLAILGNTDGGSPAWGDHLYTKQSFPRGNNLRVGFRMWNKFGTNAQTAFHGGFHNSSNAPVYSNLEAGVDYTYSDFRWGEATDINPIQQGKSLTGINTNFNGNTKNGSMLIKILLGNTRGARLDWYRTDVNSPTPNPKAEPEIDTIGLTNQPTGQGGNSTLVTGQAANVYVGFGNFDADAGTTYIDDIVVENDEVANPGGKTILFVYSAREWRSTSNQGGGFVPGGDYRIMQLLEQMGYNVVAKDDNDSLASDADNVDAVVISSTVGSGNVNTKFRDTSKGVLVWESALFDDMNMVTVAADAGTAANQTQVHIESSNTTLTAGLTGDVPFSVNDDLYRFMTIAAGATGAMKIASIVGNTNQAAIVAFDQGGTMANGFTAPGRRVAFCLADFRASETMTPQGKLLFKSAVDWIAGGGSAPPPVPNATRHWELY